MSLYLSKRSGLKADLWSVDPGVHFHFIAVWGVRRVTGLCALLKVETRSLHLITLGPHDLIVEQPQVYGAAHQKGDQADIVNLAISVGRMLQRARDLGTDNGSTVLPSVWKGQVPKEIAQRRYRAALTRFELEVTETVTMDHNYWDAIGLGLWKLHRLPRQRRLDQHGY